MQNQSTVRCSNCGQPISARVYSFVDAQQEPQAKAALVNQQLNRVPCPNCGHVNTVLAPLLYHDASKELLISYMPMELNMTKDQQEHVIGDLMKLLPKENFKGYMFNPKRTLTMNGLIEMVLGADGITPEMIQEAKNRSALVQQFVEATDDDLDTLIQQHDPQIDGQFIQMFTALAQRLIQAGRAEMAQAVLATQQVVVAKSTYGTELMQQRTQQEQVIREIAAEIEALGNAPTRDDFVVLARTHQDDDMALQALVGLARPAFDYEFFTQFTAEISKAPSDERPALEALRDKLSQLTQLADQQSQMRVGAAVELLQMLLSAQDIDDVLRENVAMIDDTFLMVLTANIQEAERRGDIQASAKMKSIYERVMALLQEAMPEEVKLVNLLLQAPSLEDARKLLMDGMAQYGEVLLDVMVSIGEQLTEEGRSDLADRLSALISEAETALGGSQLKQ